MSLILYFIVPCYNEEEIITETARGLEDKMEELESSHVIDPASRILFVDDGSSDSTWSLIKKCATESKRVKGISLKRNYGQQTALYAGMLEAMDKCDVAITLDADGQHDLAAVDSMIEKYKSGSDVVCAVRANKGGEKTLKRIAANLYCGLLSIRGVKLIKGHSEYRLVSADAIKMLAKTSKSVLFLRTDFLKLPLKVSSVNYTCNRRRAGRTKYPFKKLISLAADGLASNNVLLHNNKRDRIEHVISDCI